MAQLQANVLNLEAELIRLKDSLEAEVEQETHRYTSLEAEVEQVSHRYISLYAEVFRISTQKGRLIWLFFVGEKTAWNNCNKVLVIQG